MGIYWAAAADYIVLACSSSLYYHQSYHSTALFYTWYCIVKTAGRKARRKTMCWCCDGDADTAPRPNSLISLPRDVRIHVPRNRTDQHGMPVPKTTEEIRREDMEGALALMAEYLQGRDANITAITVGGAVNAIFLQTRPTTHDVDIFGSTLDNHARVLLDEAMQHAQQNSAVSLGTDWFNTETQLWMTHDIQENLTNTALERNVVVFQMPGLTLLAAPWGYAFTAKLSRIASGTQVRAYDQDDAVAYSHQIILGRSNRPVRRATIER